MLDRLFGVIRRAIASSERDRIEEKLERFDERLDALESTDKQIYTRLEAIHDTNLANNEALEQKLNSSKANQEMLRSIFDVRFEYMARTMEDIKTLIRGTCER